MPDGIVYINQPQITKVAGGDPAILDTDPLAFASKVSVDLYFKDSEKPDYLDIVVVKNGDAANAKVLKGNVNAYPVEIDITGQMLTDLFEEQIVSGDQFDIGANYIKSGKTYLAFPLGGGASYGPGVSGQPGASPTVRYGAICGFEADDFLGNFTVVTDGWADFGEGSTAMVTKVDESTLSITYPIADFKPILLKVDPADNTIQVARQELGDYGPGWPYGMLYATSVAGNDNFVDPCNGRISVRLGYTVSAGSFGDFLLVLQR
ncbi:hypothetical protein GCM10017764_20960 [Sphingobacterium griseoflavum]|uniref:IgGFc-binding protein N-terminal domain-containing protein n=2 Tax=Sphingobacterium griseoflavum TaxID=1474952 RepID=A0ABQ3HV49_9SPHI|nr:hypothetical protein GCM10017764_20960 [Sphingobacterium griseoflavum]